MHSPGADNYKVKGNSHWLALANVAPETIFQFERYGYFVADRFETRPDKPVFNRTVTLRDSWAKA